MATILVRKDGTGSHLTIQGAIVAASVGDVIDIGPGTFVENIDLYKNGITLKGAGRNLTTIQGLQETAVVKPGTWTVGQTTINVPGGTAGFLPGRLIAASGIPANTRIVSVAPTSIVISAATTIAKTNLNMTMAIVEAAVRVRSVNPVIKDLKIIGLPALATRASVDNGALMFRGAASGSSASIGYLVENCEITANGDSAIMTEPACGGGTITNCLINGQTFVGSQPAQVHGFSTLQVQGNILTSTTVEFPAENVGADMIVNSTFLAVAGFVDTATKVASISGNVVTLNKPLLSGVGTTQTFTLNNIQFIVPNVARQMVVFQPGNTSPVTFTNNIVKGMTGAGVSSSYNTAVTIDPASSVVTGNLFDGTFKVGYALRVRGAGAVVENNTNIVIGEQANAGFYIGLEIGQNVGSNLSVSAKLVEQSQVASGDPVGVTMSKDLVKGFTAVAAHPTLSTESNWKIVSYVFKKVGSALRLVSGFKNFVDQKSVKLKPGMSSGDSFQLHKIIVSDSSRNHVVIPRADVASAESYDFNLK